MVGVVWWSIEDEGGIGDIGGIGHHDRSYQHIEIEQHVSIGDEDHVALRDLSDDELQSFPLQGMGTYHLGKLKALLA